MQYYRLYRLDGAGKISSAEWIEAASDDEALGEAKSRVDSLGFELWQRNRLIQRSGGDGGPASNGSAPEAS